MKLHLIREQDSGMLGGISFILKAKVSLDDKEREIINKYKAGGIILMSKEVKFLGSTQMVNITINDLTSGQSFKSKDVGDIITYEDTVKSACQNFKAYLFVMSKFGGEEIIEIN
jgi:hypothetical protein